MLKAFGRLRPDRSGNFGLIMALLTAPLAMAMGVALDIGYALDIKTEIQSAADSAAVGALSEQSAGVIAALSQGLSGQLQVAEEDAGKLLTSNLQSKTLQYLSGQKIVIKRTGATITSHVEVTASVPTSFLGLFGRKFIDVTGVAEGSFLPANYIDFFLLLDNSPSMGLGATTSDISRLEAANDGCAFACHDMSNANNAYALAKSIGVMTRIELVSEAAQAMMKTATEKRRYSDQYRMAVYSMGAKAENAVLTSIAAMSSNLANVSSETAKIDLMTIPHQNYNNDQQTDLHGNLEGLMSIMGNSGSGANASDRQKVLFLVSDGVEDVARPACIKRTTNGTRCQAPLDPTVCESIKKNGVSIAVLYTTYQPIENNDWYKTWIKPFRSEIPTAMKSCATDGLFFEVSPSEGIEDAMNALFLKVINMPRLTM
jgi:Flp pilus assembly protein TadG